MVRRTLPDPEKQQINDRIACLRELAGDRVPAEDVENDVRFIAKMLIRSRMPRETVVARQRYQRAVMAWLVDEGDVTPPRLLYWYELILSSGHDSFLEALLDVLRAVDRSAVQSILQSLNGEVGVGPSARSISG